MEVQMISKEDVKPSTPTPPHLKTFNLSLLDQLMPPHSYAPIVLFYPMNKTSVIHLDVTKRLKLLKKSLSETLTLFYPLAGKIESEFSIDCNDQGANFIETRVNCCLDQFLTKSDLIFINKLLPSALILKEPTANTYVTNIQVNVFECGGIAIGISISHKMVDGAALSTFLEGWTTTSRCCEKVVHPKYTASALFPANDLWLRDSSNLMWGSFFRKGNCITRRLVFDASSIGKLKSCSGMKCPTRVEAVSGFLWKSIVAAFTELYGIQRPCLLTHLVNLRTRMEPSLSRNTLGNFLWIAHAEYRAESEPEFNDLAGKVRQAISRIDDKFVQNMKGNEGKSWMSESMKRISEVGSKDGVDCLGFSSWCNFGYYNSDFGWGNPVWVSSIGLSECVFMNLIMLVDNRTGDGIEAWVTLDKQVMALLVSNPDLIKLASIDPSPFN